MSASVWATTTKISGSTLSASQSFTAVQNQDTFNITGYIYAPYTGALELYKNGLHLVLNVDWVEVSTGDSFSITSAATAGDIYTAVASVGISAVVPGDVGLQAQLDAEQAARIAKDDLLKAEIDVHTGNIATNTSSIATNTSDITAIEAVDVTQNGRLTSNETSIASLIVGQTGGIIVFTTYALLDAYTPTTAEENTSFKVTNDPTSNLNGYYSWVSGTTYTKDADAVANVIDANNTSDGVSGFAVAQPLKDKANLEAGKNLINPATVLDGYYLSSTGSFTVSPSNQVFDFIAVVAGETYSPNKTFRFSTYYDQNYSHVTGGSNSNFSTPFVIPSGVSFVRLTGSNQSGNTADTYQLEKSLTSTNFEPFTQTVPVGEMSSSFIPARAVELDSPITFKNICLFDTYRANTSASWDINFDGNGALVTVLTNNTFGLISVTSGIDLGDDYEITVYYELEDLNCDSVDIKIQTYFSNSEVSTLDDIKEGEANSFTVNVQNNTSSSTSFQVTPVCNGAETVALGYFAKVRFTNVTVVKREAAMQYVPRLNAEFGQPKEGTTYLTLEQRKLYTKLSTTAHLNGRNLVNLVNDEEFSLDKGLTEIANNSNTSRAFSLKSSPDSYMTGRAGIVYYKWQFIINSFNGDSWDIVIRGGDGDGAETFYQKDVGSVITMTAIRPISSLGTAHFLLSKQDEIVTNGVSGASNDGNETIGSITLVNAFGYFSELYIPITKHTELFALDSLNYSIDTFANQQIQELKMNTYGDSITEHNYPKFLGVEGYNFAITRYGLRANVSDKAGTGTGAANFASYNVMTDDADIVMIMFGTHDMGNDVAIGSIGTLDIDTYIGAMEILIQGLIIKYPSKLILISTPPQRAIGNTENEWLRQETASGVKMRSYIDNLILLCNQYGLQYFDMWAGAGVSPFNMSGAGNLYVSTNASDNTLIDGSGVAGTDSDWFSSEHIAVDVLKNYRSSVGGYLVEYGAGNVFIRRSPTNSVSLSCHPNTVTVRVSINKTATVIDGTSVGVSIDRYSFADAEQATMPDRVHPNEKTQRLMCATIEQKLKPILDSRRLLADLRQSLFIDGD